MKFTLIPMIDFVSQIQDYVHESRNYERGCKLIFNYLNFLKEPIKLWMFLPCDENDEIMLMPGSGPIYTHSKEYEIKWRESNDKCLFTGFFDNGTGNAIYHQLPHALVIDMTFYKENTVEYLLKSKCEINLSKTAIKELDI